MADALAAGIVAIVAACFLALVVFLCWSEITADTIIVDNGGASYACNVSRVNKAPHRCKHVNTPSD